MVTLVALAFFFQSQRSETVSFQVEGVERTALVFRPEVASENPPVVFVFHGHGGGSRQVSVQLHLHTSWPEAVVVYPQGIPGWKGRTDAEGVRTGWQGAPGQLEDRDVKFFDEMVNWVGAEFGAVPSRTFVTGHSNGALMTWVLQTVRGDKVGAFAGICAPASLWFRKAPVKPMFVIAGTEDELVGIRGMRLFADAAIKRNACGSPTVRTDGISVYSGKEPVWVWIYEGGHKPPADTGKRVVEFFRESAGNGW